MGKHSSSKNMNIGKVTIGDRKNNKRYNKNKKKEEHPADRQTNKQTQPAQSDDMALLD